MAERAPDVLRHCNRVARYAAGVGSEMSLDAAAIDTLVAASRLHDVGKVAMPEALLTKPSALAPGEAAIMERHVLAGAEILACAPTLAPIAPIVLASHEWFDGGGYPGRLCGRGHPAGQPHHRDRRRLRHDDRDRPRSHASGPGRRRGGAPPRAATFASSTHRIRFEAILAVLEGFTTLRAQDLAH